MRVETPEELRDWRAREEKIRSTRVEIKRLLGQDALAEVSLDAKVKDFVYWLKYNLKQAKEARLSTEEWSAGKDTIE